MEASLFKSTVLPVVQAELDALKGSSDDVDIDMLWLLLVIHRKYPVGLILDFCFVMYLSTVQFTGCRDRCQNAQTSRKTGKTTDTTRVC